MCAKALILAAVLTIYPFVSEASTMCGQSDELATTTPTPPSDPNLVARYQKQKGYAVKSNAELVLIGDSWAGRWDVRTFAPFRVVNLGIGGFRTQNTLWQLAMPEWSMINARKVLLILGGNNLHDDKPCAITLGLTKVIERIKQLWPAANIGFLEIPPFGTQFLYKNAERMEVNASMRKVPNLKTINVDDAITCDWHQPCPNFEKDNEHFTSLGYRILLDAVRRKL